MRTKTWFTIFICGVALVLSRQVANADDHEFRYKAPDAKSVELMCEFNGWKSVPMTKGGRWSVDGESFVIPGHIRLQVSR